MIVEDRDPEIRAKLLVKLQKDVSPDALWDAFGAGWITEKECFDILDSWQPKPWWVRLKSYFGFK